MMFSLQLNPPKMLLLQLLLSVVVVDAIENDSCAFGNFGQFEIGMQSFLLFSSSKLNVEIGISISQDRQAWSRPWSPLFVIVADGKVFVAFDPDRCSSSSRDESFHSKTSGTPGAPFCPVVDCGLTLEHCCCCCCCYCCCCCCCCSRNFSSAIFTAEDAIANG